MSARDQEPTGVLSIGGEYYLLRISSLWQRQDWKIGLDKFFPRPAKTRFFADVREKSCFVGNNVDEEQNYAWTIHRLYGRVIRVDAWANGSVDLLD
jgi:hypothetical protein